MFLTEVKKNKKWFRENSILIDYEFKTVQYCSDPISNELLMLISCIIKLTKTQAMFKCL